MEYFKRLASVTEKYYLEITVHSVQISLPLQSSLQIVIKRNNSKREKSLITKHDMNLNIAYINSTIHFPVTLYRTASGYTSKVYFFRLIQICNQKSIKNGKAKLDIGKLVNKPLEFFELELKNCSDKKAHLCISVQLQRALKTMSFATPVIEEKPEKRISRSFDEPIPQRQEKNKEKQREKFLRRLEIVKSLNSSPQSALIFEGSDVSSSASPLSPLKSPDSPNRLEEPRSQSDFFSLKPILIDFSEDPVKENFSSEEEPQVHLEKTEILISDKVKEPQVPIEKTEILISDTVEEPSNDESEHSSAYSEGAYVDFSTPVTSLTEAVPNAKQGQVTSAEISSDESQKKCCCILL